MIKWLTAAAIFTAAIPALAKDLPPGITTPARLKLDVGKSGIWDYPSDVDAYKAWLSPGINVGFDVHSFCQDITINLYDRKWRLLGTNSSNTHAWVEYTTRYEGGYYLQVIDKTPATKDCSKETIYGVEATISCAATRQTKCTLPLDTVQEGLIRAGADRQWYRFSVPTDGYYKIYGFEDANGNPWEAPGILSLRRFDTSVIRESGNCADGLTCVRSYLKAGNYFVALRMPQLTYPTAYRLTLSAETSRGAR